jgi:DNA-directed RNA polymerase specialized sigma24 family protein
MDTTVRRHASDDELLRRYRAGDLRAFAVLYARHRLALHSVLSHLGLGDDASGIHHAAWARLVDDAALVEARDDVNAALCRFAYRAARGARRAAPVATATPDGLHDITLRSRSRAQRLLGALEALSAAERDAWLLYEGAGLTVDEVARAMDLDEPAARSTLAAAVAALRRALGRDGSGPHALHDSEVSAAWLALRRPPDPAEDGRILGHARAVLERQAQARASPGRRAWLGRALLGGGALAVGLTAYLLDERAPAASPAPRASTAPLGAPAPPAAPTETAFTPPIAPPVPTATADAKTRVVASRPRRKAVAPPRDAPVPPASPVPTPVPAAAPTPATAPVIASDVPVEPEPVHDATEAPVPTPPTTPPPPQPR